MAECPYPVDFPPNKYLCCHLLLQYPSLAEIQGAFVLAVNQKYLGIDEEVPLGPGDEVAVIPPISGG